MIVRQDLAPSFLLLQQEGYLISSCLTSGLTELRGSHVHNKGAYYSSLFNLSIGIERLLKSIVIIDHMIKNQLAAPTTKQLKSYGHNIKELYGAAASIATERNSCLCEYSDLQAIDKELIDLLSDFAATTRYHNLNALSSVQKYDDPLAHWERILLLTLKEDVPDKRKEKLLQQAKAVADEISDITATIMQGLDKSPLSTLEALSLPALHMEAAKYVVLRIINLLSPLRDLLSSLSHDAYKYRDCSIPFPQMQEFLEWIYADKQYVLRKRKWP